MVTANAEKPIAPSDNMIRQKGGLAGKPATGRAWDSRGAGKFAITIDEASRYFSIGIKKMRRLAEDHTDSFAVYNGNRYLIIRSRFEEYLLSCLERKEGLRNEKADTGRKDDA